MSAVAARPFIASREPSRPSRQGESANLDLLRSTAVGLVLTGHVLGFLGVLTANSLLLRLPRFGVLLFFVHTCLVLMYSMERRWRGEPWRRMFAHFMLRRAFRIYPLSMLVVLVTFAFRLPAAEIGHATLHTIPVGVGGLIANLLLVQNLTFTPSIIGPLWSLPLEVQMYLFLPSLFLFVRRDMSVRPLLGLWAIAVVLGLLQPLVSDRLTIVSFIPSFFPGIIAYRLSATTWPRWPSYLWPICLAAVATLFVLSRPDLHGWVPCLLTGLAVPRFKEVSLVWVRRAAHLIARYSYGIYLTHVFALWLAFIGLAGLPAEVRWVIFLSALVGLPVLLYHSVEAPLLRYGARLADRWLAPQTA